MKKALLFAHDPGGAHTLIPLIYPLQKKGYELLLYGKGPALQKYESAGFTAKTFLETTQDELTEVLKFIQPDILITGTSATDFTEKYLWLAARRLSIPSYAILDHWMNYGIRFSAYTLAQSDSYEKMHKHVYLPDIIFVMDDYAKQAMMADGIDQSRIVVTGQPYFSWLYEYAQDVSCEKRIQLRHALACDADLIITFASEPLSHVYDNACEYWGYDETTTLQSLIEALESIAQQTDKKITLVIRPHPKESTHIFQKYKAKAWSFSINIESAMRSWDVIIASDLVCSMASMMLLEAAALEVPLMSIQLGLKQKDRFILSEQKKTTTIRSYDELQAQLHSFIINDTIDRTMFMPTINAVDNIMRHLALQEEKGKNEYSCCSIEIAPNR